MVAAHRYSSATAGLLCSGGWYHEHDREPEHPDDGFWPNLPPPPAAQEEFTLNFNLNCRSCPTRSSIRCHNFLVSTLGSGRAGLMISSIFHDVELGNMHS